MKKITSPKSPVKKTKSASIQNVTEKVPFPAARNSLSETILGFNPGSIGTQLTQVDTLMKNERWYLVSNMRQLLSQCYVEHGLIQTVVDVPVDDGMRGGVDIQTEQLSEDQIKELHVYFEREDILSTVVGQALKWNRLFGGAGILILSDQNPEQPFDIDAVGEDTPLEFRAVDMWELFYDKQNTEGYDAELQTQKFEFYSYYGKKVHKSRVMKMKGVEAPSFIRPRLRGWGISIVESLINSINQFLKTNNLVFEVLDEFKVDVYKIKGFTETLLSAEGTAAVVRRLQLANQQKNFQSALTMDSEDDWDHKQLTFAGIAEMMREFRMQIACDLRMPISKIFGVSSTGFSSGEDDIENYNSMVESQIRSKSKYDILKIIEIICQKKFGFVPDDLQIEFEPLRVLSSEQEENVKTQKFSRVFQTWQSGGMTTEEFKEALNKENLLGLQIDTSIDQLTMDTAADDDSAAEGDSGANKTPSAKVAAKPAEISEKKASTTPKEAKEAKT